MCLRRYNVVMRSLIDLLLASAAVACAEDRPMTLRQAVETALKQNSDIALARLDEEKARQAVRLAKDPFLPKIVVGSGLAGSAAVFTQEPEQLASPVPHEAWQVPAEHMQAAFVPSASPAVCRIPLRNS